MKFKLDASYMMLFFCIIIVFFTLHFMSSINTVYIDIFGKRIKAKDNILLEAKDSYYLSYEFVKENIDDEIYFDNISKKIVISSDKGLIKIKVDDKKININFEDKEIKNTGLIENVHKYISLDVIKESYNIDYVVRNNTIYIFSNVLYNAKLKRNNESVYKYGSLKSPIVDYVDKRNSIKIIDEKDEFMFVKINDKEVGYILKTALTYTKEKNNIDSKIEKNNVYIFADSNNISINDYINVNGVLVDMFAVTQTTTNIIEKNVSIQFLDKIKEKEFNLYAKIDNGYDLATFDTNTMSQILSDEMKRIKLISNINSKIEEYKLDGIVLDFKNLKEKDIANYIQFVKELKAFSKKDVILNIDANEYKIYLPVINYTDFSIVNAYGQRDLKSTVAGSISEINWMNDIIKVCLNKSDNEKLVIGIPAYSILWTEKNSSIVDSQIYNLKAIESYVENNKLELKKVNGQNYVHLERGSLIYRMWLEDEFSIKNRLDIIKENNLRGIAIYKLGYENERLYDILENNY